MGRMIDAKLVGETEPVQVKTLLDLGAHAHATSVELILAGELPFEQWKELLERMLAHADSSAWWIGDALTYGEWRYGERYRAFIETTELSYGHLRNCAHVAANIPPAIRRPELSWSHHQAVAKFLPAVQDEWLQRAAAEGWTRDQLRAAIAETEGRTSRARHNWRLAVADPDRIERWTAAAAAAGRTVEEWAVDELDAAAARMVTA